jgi:hypothetical protein
LVVIVIPLTSHPPVCPPAHPPRAEAEPVEQDNDTDGDDENGAEEDQQNGGGGDVKILTKKQKVPLLPSSSPPPLLNALSILCITSCSAHMFIASAHRALTWLCC